MLEAGIDDRVQAGNALIERLRNVTTEGEHDAVRADHHTYSNYNKGAAPQEDQARDPWRTTTPSIGIGIVVLRSTGRDVDTRRPLQDPQARLGEGASPALRPGQEVLFILFLWMAVNHPRRPALRG